MFEYRNDYPVMSVLLTYPNIVVFELTVFCALKGLKAVLEQKIEFTSTKAVIGSHESLPSTELNDFRFLVSKQSIKFPPAIKPWQYDP